MTKKEIAAKIEELQSQINELKETTKKTKNYNFKRREGGNYFFINTYGAVLGRDDDDLICSQNHYHSANYCHDQDLMKKRAAEETLSRLIWREAEIANEDKIIKDIQTFYTIGYYARDKSVMPWIVNASLVGSAGFFYREDARSCIKNVVIPFIKSHPELGWELEEEEEGKE